MDPQADSRCDALLIGYENQENLGLRSIVAFLETQGWRARLVPFVTGQEPTVLELAKALSPRLVGFSLIFQYSLDDFRPLLALLRAGGVRAHFTAGGHFPSLRPEQTLELLPQMDSIVRFEGEHTITELLGALDAPDSWPHIPGLAFRQGHHVVVTPARPLIEDLDSLPRVHRDPPREAAPGIRVAAMLASRGCLFDCAFCSIRQFYGSVPGARRRVRSPASVVAEILHLFEEQDVRFFSFQDDDFAAKTPEQRRWVAAFLDRLDAAGLPARIRWKISCRVDDLEPGLLAAMVDHGLVAVYLGVESGNDEGLRTLNKRVTVTQNLTAIDLLKSAGVGISIGFMLFDPSSTFESIRENIAFLRRVGADGQFPVNFCQMLPYAGTPIESALRASGRLQGTPTCPTYGFVDARLDWYNFIVQRIFTRRNFNPGGSIALLQQADFVHRLSRSFGHSEPLDSYGMRLRELTRQSNRQAVDILDELLDRIGGDGVDALLDEQHALLAMAERQWQSEADIEVGLAALLASRNSVTPGEYSE